MTRTARLRGEIAAQSRGGFFRRGSPERRWLSRDGPGREGSDQTRSRLRTPGCRRPSGATRSAIRNHWGIENKSHYTRDVSLSEDASRIRKNPGIFARLRSFGYNILRRNQSDSIPQDRLANAFGGISAILAMRFSREH